MAGQWRVQGVSLRGSNRELLMSAMGQKQTLGKVRLMSALPSKADIEAQSRDVCFVPKADICSAAKLEPIRTPRRRWQAPIEELPSPTL